MKYAGGQVRVEEPELTYEAPPSAQQAEADYEPRADEGPWGGRPKGPWG